MWLRLPGILLLLLLPVLCPAQAAGDACGNAPARSWWKATRYILDITPDTGTARIRGRVDMLAAVTGTPVDSLQIDLAPGFHITEAYSETRRNFGMTGDIHRSEVSRTRYTVTEQGQQRYLRGDFSGKKPGDRFRITIDYEGVAAVSANPPWSEGLVRSRDSQGKPWLGMTCQSAGAATWFPCKNFQGEEPTGMEISLHVPAGLTAISNGRLVRQQVSGNEGLYVWQVLDPINLYDISFYIGDYMHWTDTLTGASGKLDLDYYVLREHEEQARAHFAVVKPMLRCFEEKLGPYPFYRDGYKLVDAPYLGMEHQSAVAYGNGYQMGYRGTDRSGTGVGLAFDFIIVHESGHEWFGNSITAFDKADTWIHEGFTTYTETIFAECLLGKEKAFRYQEGKRGKIQNDRPVQGRLGACDEGSGDHYDKAGFLVHMIRLLMDDDARFFSMLREMNRRFYHRIVTGGEVEAFISSYAGKDFSKLFDQYLRNPGLPVLEWKFRKGRLAYRWTRCVPGFDMPVRAVRKGKQIWLYPGSAWKEIAPGKPAAVPDADPGFLIDIAGRPKI